MMDGNINWSEYRMKFSDIWNKRSLNDLVDILWVIIRQKDRIKWPEFVKIMSFGREEHVIEWGRRWFGELGLRGDWEGSQKNGIHPR